MEIARSPLTNTEQVTLIQTISCAELIKDWKENGVDITDELKGHPEIRMYECNVTGLQFFLPKDVAGSDKLYEALQRFPWYYVPRKWEYDVALKTLLMSKCKRVFEVGCGDGAFIAMGVQAGIEMTGIELNPKAVEVARQRGLAVEHLDLAVAATQYEQSADAVCAFQVLEHVPNIREFLENCLRIVKPGGLLILCVPNSEGFLRELNTKLDMPPHHMSRWSARTFGALSKIFPAELVATEFEPLSLAQSGAYVAGKWSEYRRRHPRMKWFFGKPTRLITTFLFRLGLRRMGRGQSLYAVLRKR